MHSFEDLSSFNSMIDRRSTAYLQEIMQKLELLRFKDKLPSVETLQKIYLDSLTA